MDWNSLTEEQRKALLKSKKQYCDTLKQMIYERLGNGCQCGGTDRVKLRFKDPRSPLKHAFSRHPETLHSKALRDPQLLNQLALMCAACRLKLHYAAYPSTSTVAALLSDASVNPLRNSMKVIA